MGMCRPRASLSEDACNVRGYSNLFCTRIYQFLHCVLSAWRVRHIQRRVSWVLLPNPAARMILIACGRGQSHGMPAWKGIPVRIGGKNNRFAGQMQTTCLVGFHQRPKYRHRLTCSSVLGLVVYRDPRVATSFHVCKMQCGGLVHMHQLCIRSYAVMFCGDSPRPHLVVGDFYDMSLTIVHAFSGCPIETVLPPGEWVSSFYNVVIGASATKVATLTNTTGKCAIAVYSLGNPWTKVCETAQRDYPIVSVALSRDGNTVGIRRMLWEATQTSEFELCDADTGAPLWRAAHENWWGYAMVNTDGDEWIADTGTSIGVLPSLAIVTDTIVEDMAYMDGVGVLGINMAGIFVVQTKPQFLATFMTPSKQAWLAACVA